MCCINVDSGDQNPLPRRTIARMQNYGAQMAQAVGAALATHGGTTPEYPISNTAVLRCVAVELPLRYHTLPTREELIRTRDSTDFFAPSMLPTGCSGDGSTMGERALSEKVKYTHYLHKEWSSAMLDVMDSHPDGIPQYQPQKFPVSLWSLGDTLCWVAMGGEVTVGYVARFREELADTSAARVWVSGYTNQVQCYIPTQLVMDEGGCEYPCPSSVSLHAV